MAQINLEKNGEIREKKEESEKMNDMRVRAEVEKIGRR